MVDMKYTYVTFVEEFTWDTPVTHYVTLKKDPSKIRCEDAKWDELSQNWARVCGDVIYLSGKVCTSVCF